MRPQVAGPRFRAFGVKDRMGLTVVRRIAQLIRGTFVRWDSARRSYRFILQTIPSQNARKILVRLAYSKKYDAGTSRVFASTLREGMTSVDVRVAWRYYTLIALAKVGKEGRVLALEPDPLNYQELLQPVRANKRANVIPLQIATSSRNGLARFHMSSVFGNSSLYYDWSGYYECMVKTLRIDDIIPPGGRVDVIKTDIDGGEFHALKGMGRVIRDNKNLIIIVEFSPKLLEASGASPIDFLS